MRSEAPHGAVARFSGGSREVVVVCLRSVRLKRPGF